MFLYPTETARMWILIISGMLGRMIVSGDFANVFILTSEMFPTSIRSFAVSTANIAGMIGATVAPYIVDVVRKYTVLLFCF